MVVTAAADDPRYAAAGHELLSLPGDDGQVDLPGLLQELARRTNEISSHIQGFQANVCLNYGGRDEILRAAQAWGRDLLAGRQTVEDLTDEVFSRYLDSRAVPDPDLIIRPSGELRATRLIISKRWATWARSYLRTVT